MSLVHPLEHVTLPTSTLEELEQAVTELMCLDQWPAETQPTHASYLYHRDCWVSVGQVQRAIDSAWLRTQQVRALGATPLEAVQLARLDLLARSEPDPAVRSQAAQRLLAWRARPKPKEQLATDPGEDRRALVLQLAHPNPELAEVLREALELPGSDLPLLLNTQTG